MAIEVLRPGKVPDKPKYEWQGECAHCGCEMRADEWPLIAPPAMPEPISDFTMSDPQRYFLEPCATCGKSVVMWKKKP